MGMGMGMCVCVYVCLCDSSWLEFQEELKLDANYSNSSKSNGPNWTGPLNVYVSRPLFLFRCEPNLLEARHFR